MYIYHIAILAEITHNTIGHRIHYGLIGVVIYERLSKHLAHYSAFVKSIKDRSKWFYINDSQVATCM